MTDPHHGYDIAPYDEEGSPHEMWGKPPESKARRRQWTGCYSEVGYSPRGKFGPREFGSTLALGVLVQPVVLATSATIELLADRAYPGISEGRVAIGSYFFQMAVVMAMKAFAGMLRSYGSSMIRDFGAWLWVRYLGPLAGKTKSLLAPDVPDLDRLVPDGRHPRRPVLDWLFPRRRK